MFNNSTTNIKKTHYISTPDGLTAMMIEDQSGNHLYFVATDYLGSICGLMDAAGNMVEEYSYDAWGNRRNPSDWAQSDTRTSFITDRGYTGHEMLTQFGLINMLSKAKSRNEVAAGNGRVYDPAVGRFLSPDPIVQTEGGSQSMNAYSYALNNPLKYTDPSGYSVSGGTYTPDYTGINSALQWQNYNYYNSIYGNHDFWNGGAYLTRIQNFGGGSGKIWDGLYPETKTLFIPGSKFDDGSRYVTGIGPFGLNAHSFAFKMDQQQLAEALDAGLVGWTESGGFATISFLEYQGANYLTTSVIENTFVSTFGFGIPIELNALDYGSMTYMASTIYTIREIQSAKSLTKLLELANSRINRIRGPTTSLLKRIDNAKFELSVSRTLSRSLLAIGVAVSMYDMWENPSTENILLGSTDILMAGVSTVFPLVGLVYFGGRLIMEYYDSTRPPGRYDHLRR